MVNSEIVDYISQGVRNGFPVLELKQSLLARGYSDFDVDEALRQYNSNPISKKEINSGKSLSFFSPKLILYSVLVIFAVFVIVFVAIWSNQGDDSTFYLSEGLDQGLSVDLMQNKVELDVNGKNETIGVKSSSESSVDLDYGKEEETIGVGEKKNLDLDGDGVYDLEVRLDAMVDGVPKIYFKKINLIVEDEKQDVSVRIIGDLSEENLDNIVASFNDSDEISCQTEWACSGWGECTQEGIQERECKSLVDCGRNEFPESTRTCYYEGDIDGNLVNDSDNSDEEIVDEGECQENWVCGNWESCTLTGVQERNCEDVNGCGTEELIPDRRRGCSYLAASEEEELDLTNEELGNGMNIISCKGFVNRTEIGGENLVAGTVYGLGEVDSEGYFKANMSGVGPQLSLVLDGENETRATAITLASCNEPWIFDVDSTVKQHLYVGSMDNLTKDKEILNQVEQLNCFSEFSSYLRNNLKEVSLTYLSEKNDEYFDITYSCSLDMACFLNPYYCNSDAISN